MTNDTDRAAITQPRTVYAPAVIADNPLCPNKPTGFSFININPETDPPPSPLYGVLDEVKVLSNDVFPHTSNMNMGKKKRERERGAEKNKEYLIWHLTLDAMFV
ncbi:hypothetical protein NPIL_487771 [Nephila pilipes]|uniref:Uncharacterized protein n=1 Tax=Nephila pilipes TaxID=299642 RepID=A0A8X6TE27_NEPPI|nr:hypothetical protein NPIL_487771 [Nephila pilipes]